MILAENAVIPVLVVRVVLYPISVLVDRFVAINALNKSRPVVLLVEPAAVLAGDVMDSHYPFNAVLARSAAINVSLVIQHAGN